MRRKEREVRSIVRDVKAMARRVAWTDWARKREPGLATQAPLELRRSAHSALSLLGRLRTK